MSPHVAHASPYGESVVLRSARGSSLMDNRTFDQRMASMIRPFPNPADGLLLGGVFTGLGGWEVAAGQEWSHTFSAEVDKHARAVFQANFGAAPDVGDIMSASPHLNIGAWMYTLKYSKAYSWRYVL